jgi:hypothetical protein
MARAKHPGGVKTSAHGTNRPARLVEFSLPVIAGGLEPRDLIHQRGSMKEPDKLIFKRRASIQMLVCTALLALCAANVAAQSRPGFIPSLNATVTSVKFFEGPNTPNIPPRAGREYGVRFDRSRTRKIFWELNLSHPAPGRRIHYAIETLWHTPTDVNQNGPRQTSNAYIERDWTHSYWSHGLSIISKWKVIKPNGEMYRKEEPWGAGTYRLDFYVQGQKIASGSFEMLEARKTY